MPLLNWSAKNSRITEEKIKGPQNPSFASRTRHVQSPSFQSAGLTYKPDAFQNDPLVQLSPKQTQRELHSIFCNNLEGKESEKEYIYIYIYIYIKLTHFKPTIHQLKKKTPGFTSKVVVFIYIRLKSLSKKLRGHGHTPSYSSGKTGRSGCPGATFLLGSHGKESSSCCPLQRENVLSTSPQSQRHPGVPEKYTQNIFFIQEKIQNFSVCAHMCYSKKKEGRACKYLK